MNVYSAIQRRRSIRRFKDQEIPESTLIKLVDAARLAPSAGNLQPLEYITVSSKKGCESLFTHLKWGSHIKDGDAPPEGKRPVAYIVILIDRNIVPDGGGHDAGCAVQNILLAALEEDLGSCWLRSIDRDQIKDMFKVPDRYDVDGVVALGGSAESPRTEPARGDTRYWRDEHTLLHVPKRKLDNILHKEKF